MALVDEFEVPAGAVDDVNTSFSVSQAYVPGSLRLFWRGLPRRTDWDDGIVETDPANGLFETKMPPCLGDAIQVRYQIEVPDVPGIEIEEIEFSIETEVDLSATIDDIIEITGEIEVESDLEGTIEELSLIAEIEFETDLVGEICECE